MEQIYREEIFETVDEALNRVGVGAMSVLRQLPPVQPGQMPNLNPHNGMWSNGALQFWGGFLAGKLWLLWQLSGDNRLLRSARDVAYSIEPLADMAHIDTGFALYYGACLGYELTGDERLKSIALKGAKSMSRLYNDDLGVFLVRPAEPIPGEYEHLYNMFCPRDLLIDTGATLPLIMWAARFIPSYRELVQSHFQAYLSLGLLDERGRAYHALDFTEDLKPGRIHTHQGYKEDTHWTRGQAWAALGYAQAYNFCGNEKFLEAAQKCIGFFLERLGDRIVPPFDFEAPQDAALEDTCSTTIICSAILRLPSEVTPVHWRQYVVNAVQELTDNYLSPGGTLLHGSWGGLWGRTKQSIMPYGNYFFTDLLFRLKQQDHCDGDRGFSSGMF